LKPIPIFSKIFTDISNLASCRYLIPLITIFQNSFIDIGLIADILAKNFGKSWCELPTGPTYQLMATYY